MQRSRSAWRAGATWALLGALAIGPAAHAENDVEPPATAGVEFALERVTLEPVIASQRTDLTWFRPIDGALVIGPHRVAVKPTKKGLVVATAPSREPSRRISESTTIEIAIPDDHARRKISVHVRAEPNATDGDGESAPTWSMAVVEGRRLTVKGVSVDLVDLDSNGRFSTTGGDGYRAAGSTLTLPLTASLIVGAERLTIRHIDDERLVAEVEALATNDDQRRALKKINGLRMRAGLPPVTLDRELSAACTAHALYLKTNHWSGYSNPHDESEKRPGYSPEGQAAARKSVIMAESHSHSIDAYMATFYHRGGFTDPFLLRVGISTGTVRISVIDVSSASPPRDERDPVWKDPILFPADGSVGFETRFCGRGEVPEPTSTPQYRGNPLTVLFARWDHGVIDFSGELVLLDGDKVIPVPTLVAEAQQGSRLLGLVPKWPLRSGATYRVTYQFGRYEEPTQTATATFHTR